MAITAIDEAIHILRAHAAAELEYYRENNLDPEVLQALAEVDRGLEKLPQLTEALRLSLRNVDAALYMLPAKGADDDRRMFNQWRNTLRAALGMDG